MFENHASLKMWRDSEAVSNIIFVKLFFQRSGFLKPAPIFLF